LSDHNGRFKVSNCKKADLGESYFLLDFKKQVTFSALSLWTSNERNTSIQPSLIQVFRAF
jgi:hypothetical protein